LLINLEIKKCLYIVLAILLAMVGLVGLATLGFDIPVLRQAVGFIFLTFVPGILILRILKVHNISTAESLVYSVGLSLAFVMFLGFFVNMLYPLIGVSKPISLYPVITAITFVILILCAIAYLRDKDFLAPKQTGSLPLFSPPYLFLILLPLLAILGALLVNYHQNNILLLIFIGAAAVTVALVAFDKFIPEKAYPLAIVMIAIALLYQTTATLASSFLAGYDIQAEYLVQGWVHQSGYWTPTIPGNLNTALSLMILCPIYSFILNMEAVWVFKIIYPLFFCLVPLALFQAYCEQLGSKRAFFSVLFFMSVIYFCGVGNRMMIAELFFALLILLMVDRRLPPIQKSALAIICVMALPISYYGLAYICLFLFAASWLLLALMKNKTAIHWWTKLTARFGGSPANPGLVASTPEPPPITSILTGTLVTLYIVFALGWYMYTAGVIITSLVNIGQHVVSNIGEFFNPLARESLVVTAVGADFASASVSTLGRTFRVFQYITQIFIITGFIRLLLKPRGLKFRAEYVALTMVSALFLFFLIVLPYFSSHLEVERGYHFCLFLLSPLCVLGGEAIWQSLSRLFKAGSSRLKFKGWLVLPFSFSNPSSNYLKFLALGVLIPYFLFNTGFIFEIARSELYNVVDTPSSGALSGYRLDVKVCNHREHAAMEWLPGVVGKKLTIYADEYGKLKYTVSLYGRFRGFPSDAKQMPENAYIFLGTWNIDKNEVAVIIGRSEHRKFVHISLDALPELSRLINSKNLIYNNGGAHVLGP